MFIVIRLRYVTRAFNYSLLSVIWYGLVMCYRLWPATCSWAYWRKVRCSWPVHSWFRGCRYDWRNGVHSTSSHDGSGSNSQYLLSCYGSRSNSQYLLSVYGSRSNSQYLLSVYGSERWKNVWSHISQLFASVRSPKIQIGQHSAINFGKFALFVKDPGVRF